MNNKIQIIILFGACLLAIAPEVTNADQGNRVSQNPKETMDVRALAKQYNAFQHQVGQKGGVDFEKVLPLLFSESFTKTANGVQLVSHRNGLKDQLLGVYKAAGKWDIDVKEISSFQDPQRCLIRYFLTSEKAGKFDVMATLRMNKEGLIEEIDEIYYQPISGTK